MNSPCLPPALTTCAGRSKESSDKEAELTLASQRMITEMSPRSAHAAHFPSDLHGDSGEERDQRPRAAEGVYSENRKKSTADQTPVGSYV